MNIILDANGRVLMYSETGTPAAEGGCKLVPLAGEDKAAFIASTLTPNDGVIFDGKTFAPIPQAPEIQALKAASAASLQIQLAKE